MAYRIEYAREMLPQLRQLTGRERATLMEQVDRQLVHQPAVPTRNRKALRANPIAPWELRVGHLRVYYDVRGAPDPIVTIRAIGLKVRDRVYVGGEEIEL